jgi:predicted ribonuclease YlaK
MAKPTRVKKHQNIQHFLPRSFRPITENQKLAFDGFKNNNLVLHGMAGTGKSFITLYLALEAVLQRKPQYDKVVILRSVVPSRDIGFLPGSIKEKIEVYEEPYKIIVDQIFGRGDAYGILKNKYQLEFATTSYLRGVTLDNCIVMVDESQNCNYEELRTIITRMGENSKIVFCGDLSQTDLYRNKKDTEGFQSMMKILDRMEEFRRIEFGVDDIVRSKLVRSFLITEDNYWKDD